METGVIVLAIIAIWVGYQIRKGYLEEINPSVEMRKDEVGLMVPVCKKCQARLVAVTKSTGSGVASFIAVVIGIFGIGILFFNIILGILVFIVAILIGMSGRGSETILKCPSCG